MSPTPLGDALIAITAIERQITNLGHKLLGLQNDKRNLILKARQLEFTDKAEHEVFKLRYHHAVEDVKLYEADMDAAGKRHKEAKQAHDGALELLTKLEEKTEEQVQKEAAIQNEQALPLINMGSGGDAWRNLPLGTLKLSQAILDKLNFPVLKASDKKLGEVTTLGGLVDLTSKSNLAYSQLKGISSTTSGKIEEAWMEFWKTNPQYCTGGLKEETPAESSPPNSISISAELIIPSEPISPQVDELGKHGLKTAALDALKAGGHNSIASLEEILQDDDLLGDVVGKKAVKNVRLAVESWRAMKS